MTRDDLFDVFLLLRGYWPHSAPDPDNETDVAFFWKELHDLELTAVADGVAELAKTKEFCPPIGILAEAARRGPPPISPALDAYVPELGEGRTEDDSETMIRACFAEARESLKRSAARKTAAGRNP